MSLFLPPVSIIAFLNEPKSLYILARTAGASACCIPLATLTTIEKIGAPTLDGNANLDNQRKEKLHIRSPYHYS